MSINDALWITTPDGGEAPVFRKSFSCRGVQNAVIDICGLGWFELYVNGKPATDALFEPPVSTYSQLNGRRLGYPLKDIFASPRIYYCRYDITELLKSGENLISVHLGNGWYNQHERGCEGDWPFGKPKLAFSVSLKLAAGGAEEIKSDLSVLTCASHIIKHGLYLGETHDLSLPRDFHMPDFDEADCVKAVPAAVPEVPLTLFEGFPKERAVRTIMPKCLGENGGKMIYDLGENISGRLVFDTDFKGSIQIEHAEEIKEDGTLDFTSSGGDNQKQVCTYIGDGRLHKDVHPHFSWQAFRYFSVEGEVESLICRVIHTDMPVTADFRCENDVINGLLDIYKRAQLTNIHGCVPSDCPHRERLGYTGDGQITAETAMQIFDARGMYQKWMQDIADCQNTENGHIQHTAPFFGGGGGPGGWGGAAIVIPYTYYKVYGDDILVKKHLGTMLGYLDYMDSRTENGLVVREEEFGWYLGDWCFEGSSSTYDGPLSPNYVNTCYLIKFCTLILELDHKLKLSVDREKIQRRKERYIKAVTDSFYDENTGDFCTNVLGSNAFALDIGLGDKRTLENLAARYDALGGFDTGIFGTEIMLRILCENERQDIAFKLLSSRMPNRSFGYMLDMGATTLWEFWDGRHSHNHPMFGGCVKTLWNHFLGIKNLGAGFDRVLISPCDIEGLGNMSGYLTTPHGKISVELSRADREIKVEIPEGIQAEFSFGNIKATLNAGQTKFSF